MIDNLHFQPVGRVRSSVVRQTDEGWEAVASRIEVLPAYRAGLAAVPEVGIFAQRAKDQPNPIGITTVRLVAGFSDVLAWVRLVLISVCPGGGTSPMVS